MSMPYQLSEERLAERWSAAICDTLGPITGKTWTSQVSELQSGTSAEDDPISLIFEVSGPLSGMLRFSVSRSAALQLNLLFTGAESQEWSAEQQEAIEELCRQIAGQFAAAAKADIGDLHLELQNNTDFRPGGPRYRVALAQADGDEVFASLELDEALQQALNPASSSSVTTSAATQSNNLDLLLDVELDVTLRFGQRQMLLQDILELQTGSVVELDREINDPVELLLDDRVIARGRVVVVDGSYGLQVTEVGPVGL